jgi:hypothetical protein
MEENRYTWKRSFPLKILERRGGLRRKHELENFLRSFFNLEKASC